MKKWMVTMVVLMLAGSAMAQFSGLPIGGGAAATEAGALGVSGGVVLGDEFNLYGGRMSFAPAAGLSLFGDLGAFDPDLGDMGVALQGGALFTLPVDLPVDLGLRGTIGWTEFEMMGFDADSLGINGGLVVSKTIDLLTPYAYIGINYVDATVETELADVSEDETDIALAGGLSVALNNQVSLYGEIAYIDDVFFGLGGRIAF